MGDEGASVRSVGESVYAAAIDAVNEVADGVPAWLIVVAVNAAVDEMARGVAL